jgi:hypothetical protein
VLSRRDHRKSLLKLVEGIPGGRETLAITESDLDIHTLTLEPHLLVSRESYSWVAYQL